MSAELKAIWRWLERRAELVLRMREAVTQLGDCPAAWAIAEHAIDEEEQLRRLAMASGCEKHLRIP
jgi:hypothetical protein